MEPTQNALVETASLESCFTHAKHPLLDTFFGMLSRIHIYNWCVNMGSLGIFEYAYCDVFLRMFEPSESPFWKARMFKCPYLDTSFTSCYFAKSR